jgi:Flp pilus assembly protein CpaB
MVDLAAVYQETQTQSDRGPVKTDVARIILQNIKVLIVGNKYNPVYQENPAGVIEGEPGQKPITFAVRPRDAAIIHHVSAGRTSFRLLLKNTEDKDLLTTMGYSRNRLEDETRNLLKPTASGAAGDTTPAEKTENKVVQVWKAGVQAPDQNFTEVVRP